MRPARLVVLLAFACTPPPERLAADGTPLSTDDWTELRRLEQASDLAFHPVSTPDGDGFQVREGLGRYTFSTGGLTVVDRRASEPRWRVGLSLRAFGPASAPRAPGRATLWAEGGAFEASSDGLVEYAVHDASGLEHGFRVSEPVGGERLVLDLQVTGARPYALDDGAAFLVPGLVRVDWRDLRVLDATGRVLEAATSVDGDRLRVSVDTRGAAWPVDVDPTLTVLEIERGLSTSSPSSWLGHAIDADGDRLMVGDPADAVGVLVERNTDGTDAWGPAAQFDTAGIAHLGFAVALRGDTAVVASESAQQVYVYRNVPPGWELESLLAPPLGAPGYGWAVDLDLDHLVVGAPEAGSQGIDAGLVYVYRRDEDGGFVAQGTRLEQAHNQERFGAAVSVSGDRVLIGGPGQKRAYVYDLSGATDPRELAALVGPVTDFGGAVSLDGHLAAVGAPASERVYVYELEGPAGAGEDWGAGVEVAAPAAAGGGFGAAVAISGDTLAVTDRPSGGLAQVHLFERRGGGWGYVESLEAGLAGAQALPVTLSSTLLAVGSPEEATWRVWRRSGETWRQQDQAGAAGDQFGAAVAVAGDRVLIGAPRNDTLAVDGGKVTLFSRDEVGVWSTLATRVASETNGRFGSGVDLNDDLALIGSPGVALAGYPGAGAAEVLVVEPDGTFGASTGLENPYLANNTGFGSEVSLDGDRALVGAPDYLTIGFGYLFQRHHGGTDAWELYQTLLGGAGNFNEHSGRSVLAQDGWLWVGAPRTNGRGAVTGYRDLTPLPDPSSPGVRLDGTVANGDFGSALAMDGDWLAIGAPAAGGGQVSVYQLTTTGTWLLERVLVGAAGEQFGSSLALVGDRLFVGAPGTAKVHVHQRNEGGLDQWGRTETFAGLTGEKFGLELAADGEVLVVGEPGNSTSDAGAAHLFQISVDLPPVVTSESWTTDEDQQLDLGAPGVLAGDHDPNGTTLTVSVSRPPTHADAFALGSDGSFQYLPDANWSGADSFEYRVTDGDGSSTVGRVDLTVRAVNDAPVAVADGPFAGTEGELLVVSASVLANDSDLEGDELTAELVDPPDHGDLQLAPDGTFTFLPADLWSGTDHFVYQAVDPSEAASVPVVVTLTVAPVNDAPIALANPPAIDLDEDGIWLASAPGLLDPTRVADPDGDRLTVVLDSGVEHGALRVEPTGEWTYRPDPDWSGVDGFVYHVTDGSLPSGSIHVRLDVSGVNDPPVGADDGPFHGREDTVLSLEIDRLLANDHDLESSVGLGAQLDPTQPPAHGNVTHDAANGEFVYQPDPGWSGTDLFAYRVLDPDGAASDAVRVGVVVASVNDAPVASDDTLGDVLGSEPATGELLANDTDEEGGALTAELVAPPLGGQVTLEPDGSVTYVANEAFAGTDGFVYIARDADGAASAPARVEVVVLPDDPEQHTGDPGEDCLETTFFADRDGDGFGDPESPREACEAPPSHVADDTDCDDLLADSHPGATEVFGDGVDQDCDGGDNTLAPKGGCDTGGGLGGVGTGAAVLVGLLALRRRRA